MQAGAEAEMLQHCRIVVEKLSKGEAAMCVDERIREQLDMFADPRTPAAKLAEEVLASMQARSNADREAQKSADCEATAGVANGLPTLESIVDVLRELRKQASQLDSFTEQIHQLPNGRVLAHLCGNLETSAEDAYLCALVAAASIELLLFRSVRTSVGLLREIVELPQLKDALGPAVMAVMVYLLLPSGINLRNLVWHGFLSPAELAVEFPRMLISLLLLLQRSLTPLVKRGIPGDALGTDFSRFTQFFGEEFSAAFGALSLEDVRQSIQRSAIVLPGREHITLDAFQELFDGKAVAFLCKIVCVLEHGLRNVFATSNDSPAHLLAHTRKYYSTLDGFGQRSKHQLLLDPVVSETGAPSLLIERLGYPTYCCLLDLFMHDFGPALRSKVAHATINLDATLDQTTDPHLTRLCHVLAVCFVSMCTSVRMEQLPAELDMMTAPVRECVQLMQHYRPVFHTHAILNRALRQAMQRITDLDIFLQARNTEVTIEGEEAGDKAQARFTVRIGDTDGKCEEGSTVFSFTDRATRFMDIESPPSVVHLAKQAANVCDEYHRSLPAGNEEEEEQYQLIDDIRLTHAQPPLPLYSVMLKILKCVDEMTVTTIASAVQQEELMRAGKARSADRRQYATQLLAVAPVVQCCAKLTIAMVTTHCSEQRPDTETSTQRRQMLPLEKWSKVLESFAVCVTRGAQAQDRKGPDRALQQLLTALRERPIRGPFQQRESKSESKDAL